MRSYRLLHNRMATSMYSPLTLSCVFVANPGQPATLLLSVMGKKGPGSVSIENVGLGMVSGAEAMSSGSTADMGNGDILVTVDRVPEGEFVVMLNGTDSVSRTKFQRQSTTQMSVSEVIIKVINSLSTHVHQAGK